MPKIEDLFIPHTARSAGFAGYKPGSVAFVTNGFSDNGVLGFVLPRPADKVFKFLGIALSAFCEATVQIPPFIARGNGGSGLIVLEPRQTMSSAELGYVAAYINKSLRWRFNWYRQASVERVRRLTIPDPKNATVAYDVSQLLPSFAAIARSDWRVKFQPVRLESIYNLTAGDYHSASSLPTGNIPLVSCGDANNGIMALVDVPKERIYSHRLTIAFNGMNTLTAKYHPYQFAAKDDVALCTPRRQMRLSTEIFIQLMLNNERWRYSYFRKCYMDKLKRFSFRMPTTKSGEIDEDSIATILQANPYWQFVRTRLTPKATSGQSA